MQEAQTPMGGGSGDGLRSLVGMEEGRWETGFPEALPPKPGSRRKEISHLDTRLQIQAESSFTLLKKTT